MSSFLKYWFPVLFWATFIFFISSLPSTVVPNIFFGQDIVFHILEYAILILFLSRALKNFQWGGFLGEPKRILLVILACLIYAISDEFHQQFVPGRTSSIFDVIFDGIGIFIGSVIYQMKPRAAFLNKLTRRLTNKKGRVY